MSVNTVGAVAQLNEYAYVLRDHLPSWALRSDDTILKDGETNKEKETRNMLYIAREVAGLPTIFLAPGYYFASFASGCVAGFVGGVVKEVKLPVGGGFVERWNKWMESTVILDPKCAKAEKAVEGTVAISNAVLAFLYAPVTGVVTGFSQGAKIGFNGGSYFVGKSLTSLPDRPLLEGYPNEDAKGVV